MSLELAESYVKSIWQEKQTRQGTVLCLDMRAAMLYADTEVMPYAKTCAAAE